MLINLIKYLSSNINRCLDHYNPRYIIFMNLKQPNGDHTPGITVKVMGKTRKLIQLALLSVSVIYKLKGNASKAKFFWVLALVCFFGYDNSGAANIHFLSLGANSKALQLDFWIRIFMDLLRDQINIWVKSVGGIGVIKKIFKPTAKKGITIATIGESDYTIGNSSAEIPTIKGLCT